MPDFLVAPSAVHDDPSPRSETEPDPESQTDADNRLRRDAAAPRRVKETNVERRKKGPRIGMDWFFQEAEERARLCLFLRLEAKAEKSWYTLLHMPI